MDQSHPSRLALTAGIHAQYFPPGTTFGVQDQCLLRIAYGALQKATAAEGIGRLVQGLKAMLRMK